MSILLRYQSKRRTLQRSDSTNVRLSNVGRVQTSDWDKRRTGTNVRLVQASDQYKLRTGEFIRKNVRLWLGLKLTYCDKNQRKLNKVSTL